MSEVDIATADSSFCASCGVPDIVDVKLLEKCTHCDLISYCCDEWCQYHKSQHEVACKKRAAELRDELLFKQPESNHRGDCPICMIPLPVNREKFTFTIMSCCSKLICQGCEHANLLRMYEGSLERVCQFCRHPLLKTDEQRCELRMKRIEANDPDTLTHEGSMQRRRGNYQIAFERLKKAAELGHPEAHYQLSFLYRDGHGVEKDEGMEVHHLTEAAIGGHPGARHNLGCEECENENFERAVKHWIIAATQGYDNSVKLLVKMFKRGYISEYISKDVLAATLRAHQDAADEFKSPSREAAAKFREDCGR